MSVHALDFRRAPPAAIGAEKALLGSLFVYPELFPEVAFLRPDHFSVAEHRAVYAAALLLRDRNETANPVTLEAYFRGNAQLDPVGGIGYLMDLAESAVTPINATTYARIVYDAAAKRDLIGLCERTIDEAHDQPLDQTAATLTMRLHRALADRVDLTESSTGLAPIAASAWAGIDPPPREWLVDGWIGMGTVTSLYGAGGTGKTLLAQQLSTSVVTGQEWIGLPVRRGRVLAIHCEDDAAELHRRQAAICRDMNVSMEPLGDLRLLPRVGHSNFFMILNGARGEFTPFYDAVLRYAREYRPALIILDTAAHLFGGSELDRSQVTEFVAHCLGRLALDSGAAVVLCAHPPKDGSGYSGSSAFDASVRSRLFFRRDPQDEDLDRRVLEKPKANYAAQALGDAAIQLTWGDGVLTRCETVSPAMARMDTQALASTVAAAVASLVASGFDGLSMSSRAGTDYAPKKLREWEPDLRGHSENAIMDAINAGIRRGLLSVRRVGTNARPKTILTTGDAGNG